MQACPQSCIRPTPGDPEFSTVEHLYIDPGSCIECSACVDACPAGAVKHDRALTDTEQVYAREAGEFFAGHPAQRLRQVEVLDLPTALRSARPLRVAVVGAGSAAMYTVRELLQRSSSVRIALYEQSGGVGGFLRTAVSPDQPGIRNMTRLFDLPLRDPRVEAHFGTRVGVDVTVEELRCRYDAVVLAHGASRPRGIAGSATAGVFPAIDLLAAVNAGRERDGRGDVDVLPGPGAVVVGGGNVALDAAMAVAKRWIRTRSAAPLTRLVIVSRAPVFRPSFTFSALHELTRLDVGISVDAGAAPVDGCSTDAVGRLLTDLMRGGRPPARTAGLSVELVFGREVTAVLPAAGAVRVEVAPADRDRAGGAVRRSFVTDAVLLASGFTCEPLPGVPVGPDGAVVNDRGRVVAPESGEPISGLYVVGWAKRGSRGGVGENRRCAAETVEQIVVA